MESGFSYKEFFEAKNSDKMVEGKLLDVAFMFCQEECVSIKTSVFSDREKACAKDCFSHIMKMI